MFTIIDIETTGSNSKSDKITEIAIYKHDGHQIVDQFISLINPQRRIPFYITELTGINDELVADAPKFYEVAKNIIEITEASIFVAHNVGFDYNFIRSEFKSLGYNFSRTKLCTVKLSRKFFPGFSSYSLGKLCKKMSIPISHRHRAAGDALATVRLFEKLIAADKSNIILSGTGYRNLTASLNANITQQMIDELPDGCGVYYFFNQVGEIIYIGKSKNIRQRIMAHLNNFDTFKAMEMKNEITTIQYKITGNELISLLLESDEIKKHKPFFNRQQLKSGLKYGLYQELLIDGFIHFRIKRLKKYTEPLATFSDLNQAKGFLQRLSEKFDLCYKITGLDLSNSPCPKFLDLRCNGDCFDHTNHTSHNTKVMEAIESITYDHMNFLIIDEGRSPEEKSVINIEKGKYRGYGYFCNLDWLENTEALKSCIKPQTDHFEIKQIIKGYLDRCTVEQIIPY